MCIRIMSCPPPPSTTKRDPRWITPPTRLPGTPLHTVPQQDPVRQLGRRRTISRNRSPHSHVAHTGRLPHRRRQATQANWSTSPNAPDHSSACRSAGTPADRPARQSRWRERRARSEPTSEHDASASTCCTARGCVPGHRQHHHRGTHLPHYRSSGYRRPIQSRGSRVENRTWSPPGPAPPGHPAYMSMLPRSSSRCSATPPAGPTPSCGPRSQSCLWWNCCQRTDSGLSRAHVTVRW